MARARRLAPPGQVAAVRFAARRLARTERATARLLRPVRVRLGGAEVRRSFEPLRSVGCYVPGGRARYPSSAVMTVVPARAAGVPRIAVASPPGPGGEIDPLTVAAADECGATEIYRMGGAQAVAALSLGTRSVAPVDKIVGPGGPYVEAAKQLASGRTAVDMRAGPTELCVVADSSADAGDVAADLLSQAEHGPHSRCLLVTTSAPLARAVRAAAAGRGRGGGRISYRTVRSRRAMIEAAAAEAPEHLQVMTRAAARDAAACGPAGLVLVGPHAASAASDYALGANHVLPTGGAARGRGGLSALDFVRLRTEVRATRAGIRAALPCVRELAAAEGLPAHAAAAGRRAR